MIEKINNDHIVIHKECGCKLHIFLTDQYEEPCKKHQQENNKNERI